ncbi:MAG: hypothetical protein ACE5H3_07040, partial [Planctomycetota bacterium]
MKPILLTGLRAANLRIPKLELERNRWTAIHGPSGSGKSALLFRVLEPVARRRFQILHDPGVLPGGEEDWLAPMARRVEGLQPVLAWAGEIPRSRRGVELGAALDLWGFLASIWARCGERQCTACGTRWPPPKVEEVAVDIAGRIRAGEILHLFSHAGGCSLETLIAGGWTRARLGGRLVRLEEAPDPLPGDALLLLDRFRWSPGREHRLRESLAEAMRRGTELAWESPAGIERVPARDLCPACGRQLEARPVETLPGLREARDLILLDRAWDAWRRAPLAEWLCFPGRGESARLRIEHLVRTGLGHLAPDRTLGTLSLGEARRLELAALLGQIRRDQLVLLDEPGMGLHGKERRNLALLLRDLVGQGNTVLTADPSREFLEAADAWIELGPGGGPRGGRLVARGGPRNLPELEACEPVPDS